MAHTTHAGTGCLFPSQVTILPNNELSVGSFTVTPWCVLWIICSYLTSVQYSNRQHTDIKGYGFKGLQICNAAIPPTTTHLFHRLVHLAAFPTHTHTHTHHDTCIYCCPKGCDGCWISKRSLWRPPLSQYASMISFWQVAKSKSHTYY